MSYLNKLTVRDLNAENKKVLLRCDFNVPLDNKCNITDTKRIDEALKTINYLIEKNAKIIICSHLGKPKGEYKKEFSLKPVAEYLSSKLGQEVKLANDVVGESAKKVVSELGSGEVCMIENLRFEAGETFNDEEFSKKLASLAEIYVNDAFGTCHRAHASTVGVTRFLPSACGFLIEKEILALSKLLDNPARPFVAILGGAKVSDKIDVISSLLEKVDVLMVGGGMSYTFTNALGYSVGDSICESDKIIFAKDMMAKAKERDVKFLLPLDLKVGKEYKKDTEFKVVSADKIPEDWMGLDIGPKTIEQFKEVISQAKTVFWNGPMGVFEWDNFMEGTLEVGKAVAESGAMSVIGGGDSAAAMEKLGLAEKMTHVSTGGGASLEFLCGKSLPAIEALQDK
ncbi:MAG: phosphoglycerate kinase [Clostridia bacterium]|nr:phosphoglycerate kinase [Clostridia bacterium]